MSRNLCLGNTGPDVRNLQKMLNFHGSKLIPDGIFGPLTLREVRRLQGAATINQDGIVGPLTKLALFPSLQIDSVYYLSPLGIDLRPLFARAMAQSSLVAQTLPKIQTANVTAAPPPPPTSPATASPPTPTPTPAPTAAPPSTPSINFQNLIVQGGNQFAWNPWAPSPFVAGVTGTFVIRWGDAGVSGLKLSGQGQFSVNSLHSPNGKWTGQGGIQLQPLAPWLDRNLKFFDERLDLTSVFVTAFVQRNENSNNFQSGGGVGWQPSLSLIKGTGDDPILTLSLNLQAVKAWDLHTGEGQPISPQVGVGLGLDIWQLLHQK
ncbi:hypothetical protein GCM10007874_09030 [Labrys miyagiensis]|uniref:Peptidoglycan binding-like domain-containing protein n=1 Tax=Labrys miyagiensis TaxID=346912 RepID=A0ABQ6CDZ7_9HYPH|nr:peptidoglycan-binding domain-containing protein [Labrys miyagiensis]GLS17887.1 hypothetical protein GCM10007874_09030 [Labrys miyagiensis]